ncbi:hypothetical protein ACKWRH_21100 [Bradyrhizobium sp. Pa8]|uniref:hypothetical protein n=1 Tax=Bradyrhizobium sp. Pa8 TaxID=3386552 RepID=UPI00403F9CF1
MTETTNKIQHENLVSRLSKMQKEIISYLFTAPQPTPHPSGGLTVYHLPRTGDIIDALGRERTAANFAAVSKALLRLEKRGLIYSYRAELCYWRGKGSGYALNKDARVHVTAA